MGRGTRTFSARWGIDVLERLERRSRLAETNRSRLSERYVDEGTRMDEHPGIVFRGGPTGRRAALAAGPDVWQVIGALKSSEKKGQAAIDELAELVNLTPLQIQTAIRYYSEFPEEIDERIRRNVEEADAAEAAWRREQAALS